MVINGFLRLIPLNSVYGVCVYAMRGTLPLSSIPWSCPIYMHPHGYPRQRFSTFSFHMLVVTLLQTPSVLCSSCPLCNGNTLIVYPHSLQTLLVVSSLYRPLLCWPCSLYLQALSAHCVIFVSSSFNDLCSLCSLYMLCTFACNPCFKRVPTVYTKERSWDLELFSFWNWCYVVTLKVAFWEPCMFDEGSKKERFRYFVSRCSWAPWLHGKCHVLYYYITVMCA